MIGSREWMNISNGKLSFKQKTQLIKQVLLPATLSYSKTFTHKDSTTNSFKLTDIQIPDTAIVKEALCELENTQNQAIINHSWRTGRGNQTGSRGTLPVYPPCWQGH